MNADEKIAFEKEMQSNTDLRKSVEEQKELLKGMERMKMKNDISKAKFNYKFSKALVNVGIPVIITAAITALILNWSSTEEHKTETPNPKPETNYKLPSLNETGDSLWADADKYIPYQIYTINTSKDTVIVGKDGMVVAIPANSFVDENGNVVSGKIDFELKEALDTKTILEGGLSTMSNGELLETGGMFYINARQNGKSLKIAEGKNIYADVPSDPSKTGMLLFDGERMKDGNINWVNPKPIEKPLVPVDIKSLNFYPPLYEDSLAKMGKDVTNKKYKDSLYYSFAGRFGKDNPTIVTITNIEAKKIVNNNTDSIGGTSMNYNQFIDWMQSQDYNFEIMGTRGSETDGHYFTLELLRNGNKIFFLAHIKLQANSSMSGVRFTNQTNSEKKLFCEIPRLIIPTTMSEKSKSCDEYYLFPASVASQTEFVYSGQFQYNINRYSNGVTKTYENYLKFNHRIKKADPSMAICGEIPKQFSGLNPAKVKSIWNDKFQNTLIATKEFEERMPYIHKLCSRGNNVLDTYVKNIDKKMCTVDSMVANTLSGADKEQFLKFAARGEGRVNNEDNCLRKLGKYYDEQTKIYVAAAKKTSEEYYLKNEEKNKEADKKAGEHQQKDLKRVNDNFNKELLINIKDAYRQIGGKPNIVNGTVRVSVGTTGWKNLDQYVIAATLNRETMNYTDPFTGKKAVLKYETLNVRINEFNKYDRVLVYLIPDQLNSFMRMKQEGNNFTEKLNMLFKHEIVVLAYKGDETYFKYYDDILPGERDSISLDKVSQNEIDRKLRTMNKMEQQVEIKNDIAYQFFLQADQKRKKIFLQNEKFIRRIERVIFPCGNDVWSTIDAQEAAAAPTEVRPE